MTTVTIKGRKYTFKYKTTGRAAETAAAILDKPEEKRTPADIAQLVSLLWIVHHHDSPGNNSKLAGIDSISTSALDNPICKARTQCENANCICSHCYAITQQKRDTALNEHNIINGIILRNHLFTVDALIYAPIYTQFARIESFGDVATETQARNYLRLMKAHPQQNFGVWTKNPRIWANAIKTEGKPENVIFTLSSPLINHPTEPADDLKTLFDHVFTVYNKTASACITCRKKCRDCILSKTGCYFKASETNPKHVSKALK